MSQIAAPPDRVFVARQPIFDTSNQLYGYELLYRAGGEATSCAAPSDFASASTVNDAVLSVGLDTLTSGRPAFINISSAMLLADAVSVLPPSGVVIELIEGIPAEAEIVKMCRSLHQRGYALALDDFVPGSAAEAFLPYAKYVKVDMLATSPGAARDLAGSLRPKGVRLLAEKVESVETFDMARAAGYSLFQGFFFCKPQVFAAGSMSARQLTQLRLLAALNQPSVTLSTVEDLVKLDPSMSYRVLRCVNSAAFGLRREVRSIREALLLMGLEQIRKWSSIWALVSVNRGCPELVSLTVLRARCCELLGSMMAKPEGSCSFFLLGLCSLLDVMLGCRMEDAIQDLPLTSETRDALLGESNSVRQVLDAVIHYERGSWDEANGLMNSLGLATTELPTAYHGALKWARQLSHAAAAA